MPFCLALCLTERTQRGNFEPEQKVCFARLNRNHWFCNCPEAKKCLRQDCEIEFCFTVLIKLFDENHESKPNSVKHFPAQAVWGSENHKELPKRLFPIATVGMSSEDNIFKRLVLWDGYTFLGISISLASHLKLVGEPIHLHISGFNAINVIEAHWVKLSRLNQITPICSSLWNLLWNTTFTLVQNIWICLSCRTKILC